MLPTNEEEVLIRQALEKLSENPDYRLGQEEWVAVAAAFARKKLRSTPLVAKPDPDDVPIKLGHTMSSLTPFIQQKIRRFEQDLRSAAARGNFVEMLDRCRLHENLVPQSVVETCLCELQIHREFCKQLFDQYPHPDGEEYDPNAPTIRQIAEMLELKMIQPNIEKGQYVGPMIGYSFQSALIKFAMGKAIELPFFWLAPGQSRPKLGETVRMKFKNGELMVSVAVRKSNNPTSGEQADTKQNPNC